MTTVLLIITPIALLDSTSITSLSLLPLIVLLSLRRPILGSGAFIAGIYITNLIIGILLAFGLSSLFDQISAYGEQIWKNPGSLALILQIIIGIVLLIVGFKKSRTEESRGDSGINESITPAKAFTIAVGLMIVGLPGALPYLAAIDQLLRADLNYFEMVMALIYYNIIYILPLVALVCIRVLFPNQSERIFGFVGNVIEKWGQRVIVIFMLILGFVMVVDGIGWFLGMPLIPV